MWSKLQRLSSIMSSIEFSLPKVRGPEVEQSNWQVARSLDSISAITGETEIVTGVQFSLDQVYPQFNHLHLV